MNRQEEFNRAYDLSQHPDVRAAMFAHDHPADEIELDRLARVGHIIDWAIMAQGHDPYIVMKMRHDVGATWAAAWLQPVPLLAPGLTFPGLPSYDPDNPPPRSIMVPDPDTCDLAQWYPPWPVPIAPAKSKVFPIGAYFGEGRWGEAAYSGPFHDGDRFVDVQGRATDGNGKHVTLGTVFVRRSLPFFGGISCYWELA